MERLETPLFIRAYMEPKGWEPKAFNPAGYEVALTSDWSLTFDTETTVEAAQSLRVGFAQIRKAGVLVKELVFFDKTLDDHDIAVVLDYADSAGIQAITVEALRRKLIDIGYRMNGAIIGFNLPFDISRIALSHGVARGALRGGFSFRLSPWKSEPRIRVKHLSAVAALIDFAKPFKQLRGKGSRNRDVDVPHNRGSFIDVKTIAAALLSKRFKLATLAEFLGATPKEQTEEHGGPMTFQYLDYARGDVQTTWECYEKLSKIYQGFGLSTPLHRILSEASIGKALLREMNIRPLLAGGENV
jgi:hypothetical protein